MSDKLREARIAEAKRRAMEAGASGLLEIASQTMDHLFDVITEDWRPEPEVDAVTLAAREWMKAIVAFNRAAIDEGKFDYHSVAKAFRAGHAHALANCADVKRMDWLEGMTVHVSAEDGPVVRHRVFAREPHPLRTKIDRAMEQPS